MGAKAKSPRAGRARGHPKRPAELAHEDGAGTLSYFATSMSVITMRVVTVGLSILVMGYIVASIFSLPLLRQLMRI
jgi:hypothetical protein